jgi:hypothetical protein
MIALALDFLSLRRADRVSYGSQVQVSKLHPVEGHADTPGANLYLTFLTILGSQPAWLPITHYLFLVKCGLFFILD